MVQMRNRAGARAATGPSISEQDLNAYVDGQLTPARRRAIEQLIAGNEHVRAQVEALLLLRELVQAAYPPRAKR